jgi:hypothetical protein
MKIIQIKLAMINVLKHQPSYIQIIYQIYLVSVVSLSHSTSNCHLSKGSWVSILIITMTSFFTVLSNNQSKWKVWYLKFNSARPTQSPSYREEGRLWSGMCLSLFWLWNDKLFNVLHWPLTCVRTLLIYSLSCSSSVTSKVKPYFCSRLKFSGG